jgi:polyphosphate kinase 2 (PPK2 family)
MKLAKIVKRCRIDKPEEFNLTDHDPAERFGLPTDIKEVQTVLARGVDRLTDMQDRLYAHGRWAVLVVLQGMDAAGKDGVIKHVMAGINPQGCLVHSFKAPSAEELAHDFLWRISKNRFQDIRKFERHLTRNGTLVLKFHLRISKEEQLKRFLARLDTPAKRWKFSAADAAERERWDDYMAAYEDMIRHTSTEHAPWYVVPADHKHIAWLIVSAAIVDAVEALKPTFPKIGGKALKELKHTERALRAEAKR